MFESPQLGTVVDSPVSVLDSNGDHHRTPCVRDTATAAARPSTRRGRVKAVPNSTRPRPFDCWLSVLGSQTDPSHAENKPHRVTRPSPVKGRDGQSHTYSKLDENSAAGPSRPGRGTPPTSATRHRVPRLHPRGGSPPKKQPDRELRARTRIFIRERPEAPGFRDLREEGHRESTQRRHGAEEVRHWDRPAVVCRGAFMAARFRSSQSPPRGRWDVRGLSPEAWAWRGGELPLRVSVCSFEGDLSDERGCSEERKREGERRFSEVDIFSAELGE